MTMSTQVETITPPLAAEYLKMNNRNRPLSSVRVNRYAAEMKAGDWGLSHQGIAFDRAGRLIDGQHRLAAVIQSGCIIQSNVTRNADPDSFHFVDTGGARTGSDTLALIGVPNAKATSAALRVIAAYQVSQRRTPAVPILWVLGGAYKMENHDYLAMIQQYPTVPDYVEAGKQVAVACNLSSPSASTAALALMGLENLAKANEFSTGIITGAGLEVGDPRLTLRNRRANWDTKGNGGTQSSAATFTCIAKAWVAFREGRKISRLAVTTGDVVGIGPWA